MSSRDQVARPRALCAAKGFAIEPVPGGRVFRLIWVEVGHAVRNGARGTARFNIADAISFLRAFDVDG